jgi:hypothetical protein
MNKVYSIADSKFIVEFDSNQQAYIITDRATGKFMRKVFNFTDAKNYL